MLPASPCMFPAPNFLLVSNSWPLNIHEITAIVIDPPTELEQYISCNYFASRWKSACLISVVGERVLSSACYDTSKNYLGMLLIFSPHKQSLSGHRAGRLCRHHLCFPSAWITQNLEFNNQLQNRSRYSINHFNGQAAHYNHLFLVRVAQGQEDFEYLQNTLPPICLYGSMLLLLP